MYNLSRLDWKPETLEMKTFHIKDRSYTKERILIYTIYVINTWDNLESLFSYFSQYGKVVEISIVKTYKNPNNQERATAKIRFEKAESASLALRYYNEIHALEDMHVTYDENTEQPYHQHLNEIEKINENDIQIFSHLEFNCLNEIFKYLSQNDQIKMALICNNFRKVFKNYFTLNTFKINDDMTLKDARGILIELGEYIEKLELNRNSRYDIRFFNEIITLCPNLKCLRVEEFKISEKLSARELAETFRNTKNLEFICIRDRISCKNISQKMKILKSLELINCGLRNDDLKYLENLSQQMEHLDISENPDLTGQHLQKFINLKSLILNGLNQLNQNYFSEICIKMVKLEYLKLDVRAFTNFNEEFAEYISKMKSLKNLDIHDSTGQRQHGYEHAIEFMKKLCKTKITNQLEILKLPFLLDITGHIISNFIHLRILEIQNFNSQLCGEIFWNNLRALQELQTLNAIFNIRYGQNVFIDFIENAKNIVKIKIVVVGAAIYEKFIYQIIDVMKKKGNSSHLTIWRKSISKSELRKIELNHKFIENKSLIKLCFDCVY